ncbi:glycosyl hydrolase family 18 protein [Thalassotalea fusca]
MWYRKIKTALHDINHLKSVTAMAALVSSTAFAETVDCSNIEPWQAGSEYHGGSRVQNNGNAYEAKWWANTNPETHSGEWQEWKQLGSCQTDPDDNISPQVAITSPVNGFVLQQNDSVVISAEASDEDGIVSKVIFYVDGVVIGEDTNIPYEINWTANTIGEQQISAVATDDEDAQSEAAAITINVEAGQTDNQAPTVSLSVENLPNKVEVGTQLTFAILSSDSDGTVERIALHANDSEIYTQHGAQGVFNWQATAVGQVTFQAYATDDESAQSASTPIVISVQDSDNSGDDRTACQPAGLYQTPGVNTPYCTIYDEAGRENMGSDHPRRVIGYFTSWRTGKNGQPAYLVSDIPWDKITHINYAFAHVDANNRISIGNPNAENNPATNMEWPDVAGAELDINLPYKGHFNLLTKYKRQHPNVKTLISVGGWAETGGYFGENGRVNSGGFYTMTTNADGSINHAGIAAFTESAVAFIKQYGFDGVDIDYEYPSSMADSGHPDDFEISNPRRAALNKSYQVLMKSLREALDRAGQADGVHYMLTIASPSSGYLLRGMETFQVTQYLDYVNIMSYDLHGAWNSHVGPNAALYDTGEDSELAAWDVYTTKEYEGIGYLNTDWAVRYFRGALSAGRINIGIPYYTRGFRDVEGGSNGLWGQAKLPNQADCPKGTGEGDKNFCGNGAVGIDNLWHDVENDREVPAGSNPLWHVKNLAEGKLGSYATAYGLDPVNDPEDQLVGSYQRFYEQTAVAPWLWNAQKKVYLSIEDEESMATKVDYVINNGLGGVMFWELAGDFDYDANKQEYFMGSTMTTLAYDKFKQSGVAYDTHNGNPDFIVPDTAVDVTFEAKQFPNGDDNYPISPTFSFTNNSSLDLSGAKISFDVPVSTSAIFKSHWNAQKKLKMAIEQNGSNAAGNNIGGFENEFHRFSIELINEWGGVTESFKPGETVDIQVMYYMPITGPVNFTVELGNKRYAVKAEYPQLPDAQPGDGNGNGTTCDGVDVSQLPVYPNFPRTGWQGNPSHALAGDKMVHNNAVWEAKWWTSTEPGGSDWTQVCSL